MDTEDVYEFAKIGHVVHFLQSLFVMENDFNVFANQGEVVNIENDNRNDTVLIVNEDRMVSLGASVPHRLQFRFYILVPNAAALLCAVYRLVKFEYHTFWDTKARRGLHINFFFEFSIEICGFDIHLMYFKVKFGGEGQNGTE